MNYVGIDPGLTGALAVIDHHGRPTVIDVPVLSVQTTSGKRRSKYDAAAMRSILSGFESCTVCIEEVHAMPKQGVTSMFSMGHGLGLWEGLLVGMQIPFTYIRPQRWKKEFGVGADKNAAILKAKQLFPTADITLKKHHGRAEALLMAEFLRRTYHGNNKTTYHHLL